MNFTILSLSNLSYNDWRRGKANMAALGKIDEFVPSTGDWTQYIERMNQSFIANDICEEPKKKAILLTSKAVSNYGKI